MGALEDNFGGKGSGQLIRSEDWNGLIAAIEQNLSELSDRVDTGLGQVNDQLGGLSNAVGELQDDLTGFRDSVEELTRSYYRLSLVATRQRFAIGELGEIVARVTGLRGEPLELSDAARRPWVDFVTAWGQLKPVRGFVSRGGAGDRAISVRVDAEGIARVQVRAEHADGMAEDVEEEMAESLKTRLVEEKSVARVMLEAATPMEASRSGVFEVIAREYDRPDVHHVRRYLDTYYLWRPPIFGDGFIQPPLHRWRDYRSTILAFVKNDADPTTADPSRGVSSIQITFRDWLGPFLALDYFEKLDDRVKITAELLGSGLVAVKDFDLALAGVKAHVDQTVAGQGLLARQREYRVLVKAIEQVQVAQPPGFLPVLREAVKDALILQQTLELSQLTTTGLEEQVAVDVFTNAALRADKDTAKIGGDVVHLGDRYAELQERLSVLDNTVRELGQRTQRVDEQAAQITARFTDVDGKVQPLTGLDAAEVNVGLERLQAVLTRVDDLEKEVFRPG